MLRFLFMAEHDSVIEHAVISFMIYGSSRSFLAQITRHRMASYTSSSQHYQDYSDYPFVVHKDMEHTCHMFFRDCVDKYKNCIDNPRIEFFLTLAVNLKWSQCVIFFRKRYLRNVAEIRIFCNKLFPLIENWWPEYAKILGPPCHRWTL